ncbi:hypothetical protein [Nocardia concava]|uniref:hypothetical protein n=1 Tax=Nocardia concava TaxID=257281 RepID=UPI00031E30D8|nr:hypothetical protein [Nocardia concava]
MVYPELSESGCLILVATGRKIADITRDLDLGEQAIYTWRNEDRIDCVPEAGMTSAEKTELACTTERSRDRNHTNPSSNNT